MGFDDALNKAKQAASDHPEAVDKGIDAASDQVTQRTNDDVDQHVERGADAARDRFGSGAGNDEQGS